jgi:cation:H+ antiporter
MAPSLAVVAGLCLLVWSAGRFVDGAAALARHFGMPPLLIGMIIVGFGTSAPEMVVSAIASVQGNPGLALGNAYGSNITNIALILGLTALIRPMTVHSLVLRREMPILIAVTALAALQVADGSITQTEALVLLLVFAALMTWSIRQGLRNPTDALGTEVEQELAGSSMPLRSALIWLSVGLLLLVGSSRLLVWGAVEIATGMGISDLVIGLTVVAVGTSLPELASSLVAARRGEHDLALGNIIGSNLFNTLAVVGIAGGISTIPVAGEVLLRDVGTMAALTGLLFLFGIGLRGQTGRINRAEGAVFLVCYFSYTLYLLRTNLGPGAAT